MKTRTFLAITAVSGLCAFPIHSQDLAVSGKVVDASGKPLQGVVVGLLAAHAADTTDAEGTFDFTGKSISLLKKFRNPGPGRYGGNRFLFETGAPAGIEGALLDAKGRAVPQEFRGGSRHVIALGNAWSDAMGGPGGPGGHAKVTAASGVTVNTAAAAAGDWLQAYKPGYAPSARQIPSYTGSHTLTLTASADPDFGPNVVVFDPAMPSAEMQARIDGIHAVQKAAQFGTDRFALLFKPGAYTLNVDVGYYTQALGLGALPDDVAITGSVRSVATTANNNVTIMFWRSAENMAVTPTVGGLDTWAVSQGAPFRRMHVKGSLGLSMGGWASGGFLADSKIDNQVQPGSQQQWYSRNSEWTAWSGGVWNMAFSGVVNPPAGTWPAKPFTVVAQTPVVREKPFLTVDKAGKYSVNVPALREASQGTSWSKGASGENLPVELFHIAHPDRDDAATINAALASGKHLILTPGIYHLAQSIQVLRAGTVVLGLGMPTLVPDNGTAALSIADVDGVKVAGLLIDAGPVESPVLLRIGEPQAGGASGPADHALNPTSLHDIFLRVGGPRAGSAAAAVIVDSKDVIGDHFWIWRADHGAGAKWDLNKGRNGLIVNGDRVAFYGLFVEHFQEYQTIWNGEAGRVHFYQSEMPYDPPTQADWQHAGVNGYASYKVADKVKTHEAWGLGVYCAFRAGPIQSDHGIEAPVAAGVHIRHAVSIWLNGVDGSGIGNVLNATGGAVTKTNTKATID
ncbi:MAG: carbohydrate binding module family protein [Fibrobacteres bacterium]|nr:carbohydrate binding module family protein [Fibrobacterota bacterium]